MSDAIARYRKQLEANPANELARFSLGKALFEAGQFIEARAEFEQALTQKPDWMAVQILAARCSLRLGDKATAVAGLEKARQLALAQGHQGPLAQVEEMLAGLK